MSYPIVTIQPDAREDTEQLGSKPKFWVLLDNWRWLFKEARQNTGEDWAEKVAAEIAHVIGIRAASHDFFRSNFVDPDFEMSTLFVAWQAPHPTRAWFPIGRLVPPSTPSQ